MITNLKYRSCIIGNNQRYIRLKYRYSWNHVSFFVLWWNLTTWCSKILKVTVFMCFIGYIDANQTKTYVWKLWSAISSYYVNYFDIFNSVIFFSLKTLNIQRPCKWKYIEWFIFSMKCTFPLTSKGVSQASNLQKGMRYT